MDKRILEQYIDACAQVKDYISRQSHADTADLDELVEIAKDRGIYQKKATSAYVSVKGNTVIPIGTRFSLKSFNYRIVEAINENTYTYKAACEETGTGPNNLTGELIAIDHVDGLEKAEITEVLINGEEDESRDALYARYLASFTSESFGGNIAQYKQYVNAIAGVGGCKVQPVWNGADLKVIYYSALAGTDDSVVPSNTQTVAYSFNVDAGVYIAFANVRWSSNAKGSRHIGFAEKTTESFSDMNAHYSIVAPSTDGMTFQNLAVILKYENPAHVEIRVQQFSGSDLKIQTRLSLLKVK